VLAETYLLGRRISHGGMGEVFEATHARLPGRYAVKVLRPELLSNREAFARFCREAEVMSELRHPNVVQIYDFNTTPDGRPYFVMELLEGRDLETRLTQEGPLALPDAVRVVESVASALATAHAHGIVHRDLKPANIFLCTIDGQRDEVVKVLDFGISKIRAAGTLLSTPTDMIRSPAYMSPEQARGAADEVDERSDQFALGAITYRMLTGGEPFQGDDIASLLYQVVHEAPPPLARYLPAWWDTRALQAVLDRALAKDAGRRWSGMMEMARAFEAASEQTLSHDAPNAKNALNPLSPIDDRGDPARATLIAAPPPPPLRPARRLATAAPEIATSAPEIDESPPPIRTPPPELLRPLPERSRRDLDFAVTDEEPYARDELPVTHHRLALAGLGLLAIAAVLTLTGLYHRIVWVTRQQLGLVHRAPAAAPARPPEVAPVARPLSPVPAEPAPAAASAASTAPAETPPGAEPARAPAKPKALATENRSEPAPRRRPRHRLDDEPRIIKRPGSVYLAPSKPLPSFDPLPPETSGAPPPAPDKVPDQFTIPPPAAIGDSPSRDLAPPPLPEAEPTPALGPKITPAPPPGPPPVAPPPTPPPRDPSDQPMPPSF
jgi:eukaryotic-like serine/threonine-protein kinase